MQDVAGYPQLIGDRYRILRKIGEGGMGEVYLAEHIYIEKRVAIKLLRPEVLSNQEAVQRFRQEARSASSIGHENIIQIDDFGTMPDGRIYMAMEYLEGIALNDLMAQGSMPLPRALQILIPVARALAAAHAKGITHRDMKPENVFVTQRDGRDVPKILDFGIAKVSGADTGQNLTIAGAIFGTPFYMAPEQAMGATMDHRVDIYAMGVILYEIFTGTVPFKAETFMGILTQHITTEPAPPSVMAQMNGRICPKELENIILKAMRKQAKDRYQTMNELCGALIDFYQLRIGPISSAYVTVQRPVVRPRKTWPILVGALVTSAVVGLVAWQVIPGGTVADDAGTGNALAPMDAMTAGVVADGAPPQRPKLLPPDANQGLTPPPDAAPDPKVTPDAGPMIPSPTHAVTIRSDPPGASVWFRGRRVGVTPLVVHVSDGDVRTYTLKRNAYFDGSVRVTGDRSEVTGRLESELKRPDAP